MGLIHIVVPIALPLITFLVVTLIGMDTTVQDFRDVFRSPRALLAGMLGQYVLPLLAAAVIASMHLKPQIAAGMMVIACAPPGGFSNMYTYLARANNALSVTLTFLSCAAAFVTMPLLLHIFQKTPGLDVRIPIRPLLFQLLLLLVVPVLLGLWMRSRWPAPVLRLKGRLRAGAIVGFLLLLAFIVYQATELFVQHFFTLLGAASIFILFSMIGGYLIGRLSRLAPRDRFTVVSELGVRNVAISTTLAVTVLSRPDFAVFGTAYFIIEAPLLLAAVALYRRSASLRLRAAKP